MINQNLKEEFASNIFRKSHHSQSSPTFLKEDIAESLSEKTPTSPHVEVKTVEGINCNIFFNLIFIKFVLNFR